MTIHFPNVLTTWTGVGPNTIVVVVGMIRCRKRVSRLYQQGQQVTSAPRNRGRLRYFFSVFNHLT